MTLDISKFITNSIAMQAKIQHCDIKVKTVKENSIPHSVKSVIIDEYGDRYLLDADYIVFIWGAITKNTIKSIFNVVDKALGRSANKLTSTDFKKINISLNTNSTAADDNVDDNVDDINDDNDQTDSIDDANDTVSDDVISDDNKDESIDSDTDDDSLNENKSTSTSTTSYFFLKITCR